VYVGLQYTVSVLPTMLCLRSEDAFVITCVANLMEVKLLYVQQNLRVKFLVTGVSMFNNIIPTLTEHETYLHLH
jgi:hypothetical protein